MGLNVRLVGLAAAALALALDQISKYFMRDLLEYAERPIALTSFLDLFLSWNKGFSYSLLHDAGAAGRFGLLALALVAVIVLARWLWRATTLTAGVGLGLVIGGALGNALDRAIFGAVEDFLYFHTTISLGPLSNYVFNVADAAISVGVGLLLVDLVFFAGKAEAQA